MGGVSGGAGKGAEGGRDKSKLRAGRFWGKMRTPGAQYREIGLQRGSHSGGGSRVGFEGPGRGMRGKVSLGVSTGYFTGLRGHSGNGLSTSGHTATLAAAQPVY